VRVLFHAEVRSSGVFRFHTKAQRITKAAKDFLKTKLRRKKKITVILNEVKNLIGSMRSFDQALPWLNTAPYTGEYAI
jgi:hypothetical protein